MGPKVVEWRSLDELPEEERDYILRLREYCWSGGLYNPSSNTVYVRHYPPPKIVVTAAGLFDYSEIREHWREYKKYVLLHELGHARDHRLSYLIWSIIAWLRRVTFTPLPRTIHVRLANWFEERADAYARERCQFKIPTPRRVKLRTVSQKKEERKK